MGKTCLEYVEFNTAQCEYVAAERRLKSRALVSEMECMGLLARNAAMATDMMISP